MVCFFFLFSLSFIMPPGGVSCKVNIVGPSSGPRNFKSALGRSRKQTIGMHKMRKDREKAKQEYENMLRGKICSVYMCTNNTDDVYQVLTQPVAAFWPR